MTVGFGGFVILAIGSYAMASDGRSDWDRAFDLRGEGDSEGDGERGEHRPVFNVSTLDHTHCLHMNDPALHMMLDMLDDFDLAEVEDRTARAMFHHLYNAGDRRPPRRDRRG